MKKTILMIATAAAAALSLSFVAGNKVSADTVAKTGANTNATIQLTAPKNADGSTGVELTQAPDYSFGNTEIKSDAPTTATVDGKPSLQVVNLGNAAKWGVTAQVGAFKGYTTSTDGTKKDTGIDLAGASLEITSTEVKNSATTEAALLPTAATQKFEATTGAQTVLAATQVGSAFQGVGTTDDDTSATISVPLGNVAGSYSADITWTLTQDPASTPAAE